MGCRGRRELLAHREISVRRDGRVLVSRASREFRVFRVFRVWGFKACKVSRVGRVARGMAFKVRRDGRVLRELVYRVLVVRMASRVPKVCKVLLASKVLRDCRESLVRMGVKGSKASREARACKVGRVSAPRVLLGRRETWVLRESKGSRGM
jgi:hypothetical protein